MSRRPFVVAILSFWFITLLYVYAVFSAFKLRGSLYPWELVMIFLTSAGGLAVFLLGYASVTVLGGKFSLGLVEFIARLNGSRHIIEVKENPQTDSHSLSESTSLLSIPALVLIISLALALNIHYLHVTTDFTLQSFQLLIFHDALSSLDIFLKPTNIGSLQYSIEIIPLMTLIVALAGVVPSMVLPYLRKFKVTGINSAPFNKDLLLNTLGTVLGLSIVFSLFDILYGILLGNEPHYYNYALPTILGFSLHYSLGAYAGREKAEKMVEAALKTKPRKRVLHGKISINGLFLNEERKPAED